MKNIRLVAFDLDGTLTQHKTPLNDKNREALERLSKKYKLVMVGAGNCFRIHNQLGGFPMDVIGNYGMQVARYDNQKNELVLTEDNCVPCDNESVDKRITEMRKKYGFTEFEGDNTEFHASGCVTFPLLGTKAKPSDKLAFDPDRRRRRAFYGDVKATFPEFTVFVGGSSSFDMAPAPYNKYYALDKYCTELGIKHSEAVFVGDDYGEGGNDEAVYLSDFNFLTIDNYLDFPEVVKELLD